MTEKHEYRIVLDEKDQEILESAIKLVGHGLNTTSFPHLQERHDRLLRILRQVKDFKGV